MFCALFWRRLQIIVVGFVDGDQIADRDLTLPILLVLSNRFIFCLLFIVIEEFALTPESSILQKTIRAYWSKRRVNPTVLFRTTPTHLEIVITWCYRKLFYILFAPCKVSNPTYL